MIAWLKRSELWPEDWPTLTELAITEAERAARRQQDEIERIRETTQKRQMPYSGGTFTFGVDAMGSLADHISLLSMHHSSTLRPEPSGAKPQSCIDRAAEAEATEVEVATQPG